MFGFVVPCAMAKRACVFVQGSRLRSCLLAWSFVAFLGVTSGRLIDDFRAPVVPKSPTKCGPRAQYCWPPTNRIIMPWSCSQTRPCFANNYTHRFDNNSGEKSKFSANLSATVFYRNPNHTEPDGGCYQTLNLTWAVRLSDSDLPVLGFKLLYNRDFPSKNINKSNEVIFFIKKENLPVDKNGITMFYFDCLRLSIATHYRFEVFSLHSSSDRVPERLARSIGVTNLNTDCDVYPDGHFTSDSVYRGYINATQLDRDCSIKVYFTPAPNTFGFRGYNVQLLLNDKVIMTAENLPFKCNDFEPVFFKNVGPGNYRLKVLPVGGRCPCGNTCTECNSIYSDFTVSESNHVCQTTATSANAISPHPSESSQGRAWVTSVEGATIITESQISIRNQNVIITVVAFIVAGVVLAIIVLVFKSRKCKGEMRVSTAVYGSDEKDPYRDDMTREAVLLIYASDNRYHNSVVRCLATYLQTHCHCDVKFDQWFQKEISEMSALDWILHQLRSVKNVIIINSEGGCRHYEASTRGVAYERIEHETPLENMFLPAVRELRNEYFLKPKSRKLFKVTFPYTDSEFIINDFQPGINYRLMAHIEDLFLNVHGLSKHSRRGKTTAVDINQKDYTKSPEGHELEKAIREACEYYKKHPDWFSYSYQEKPRKDRNNVCLSINKDWNEGCSAALQNGSSSTSAQSPVCDSGVEMSLEYQNVSGSFLKMVCSEDQQMEEFSAPDLDDVSSLSSANLDLHGEMLNKDFDSMFGL